MNEENEQLDNDFDADLEDVAYDDEIGVKAKLKKLRDELSICQKEKTEYLSGWQRAQADYINLKNEQAEVFRNISERARTDLIIDLLPALDSFDMAFANKEAWEKADVNWRKGIEYIYSQFINVLENNNVVQIGNIGENFDTKIHESVEIVDTDNDDDDHTIDKVLQKGYAIGEKVIRPARVAVRIKKT